MSKNIYKCKICSLEKDSHRKLLYHVNSIHGLNSEEYYLNCIDSRNTCIDCNTNVVYGGLNYGYPKRCKSCNVKHYHSLLSEEEKQNRYTKWQSAGAKCGGRKKGSKNTVPYVRTKPSVTDPYWLNTKEIIEKRKETWSNKSCSDLSNMISKQMQTAIKNGTLDKMGHFTYKGSFKPSNPHKYIGDITNIYYRSGWELDVMKWCDKNEDVESWASEEVIVSYLNIVDKKRHRYFVDFLIKFTNGKTYLVEVKPYKETQKPKQSKRKNNKSLIKETTTFATNQSKWHAADEFAKDRGWEFAIWTEKELQSLGILSKCRLPTNKAFKPLKKKNKNKKNIANGRLHPNSHSTVDGPLRSGPRIHLNPLVSKF